MRTESPSPLASAVARLRGAAGQARRRLAALGPTARVGLLVAALAGLGAVGYLASLDDPPGHAWAYLYEGRRLSADRVAVIAEALDAEGIVFAADPAAGRVGVKPEAKTQAYAALAKRKVVPPTLDDLMGQGGEADSPWDTPGDRDRRAHARLEMGLKTQIEELDSSIASAFVQINRDRARGALNPRREVAAYVRLRTEGGRRLGHRAVEGIQRFLTGEVPDLKPEAITVVDQTGHAYLASGNPALKEQAYAHAREEDWREQIAQDLSHIHGLGVTVLLEAVALPAPPPEPVPAPAEELVGVNRPVEVGPEPAPPPVVVAPPPSPIMARVWVRVPRSFYLLDAQNRWPGRQATPEEFGAMKETTEGVIRHAVGSHIRRELLGGVTIDTIQDDLSASRTLLLPAASDGRRPWPWPAAYGAIAAAAVLATVGALVRLATRRPAARPAPSAWRPGFVADGPNGPVPGPSERVRELIRTSPAAAAGVLQRWIGQGEAAG